MNSSQRKHAIPVWAGAIGATLCAASMLLRPSAAADGVLRGLALCYKSVIPALFPFLVLSRLILESPLANILGLALRPYTRLLSIHSKKAPAALLCGVLGGFACGARSVDALYRAGEVDREESALLLVCCIGSGPGFVVGSVGGLMLGSAGAGWLLLAAQLCASLICGLAAALWADARAWRRRAAVPCAAQSDDREYPNDGDHFRDFPRPAGGEIHKAAALRTLPNTAPKGDAVARGFVPAVRDAVNATLLLCGYVTLFSFFAAIAVPDGASAFARYITCLPLEVTSACRAACETASPLRTQFCCAALSVMGASVFFQVRALLAPDIPLLPLLVSRVLHLPLSLLVLHLLTSFFPGAAAAGLSLDPAILPAVRMPCDAMFVLFLLAAAACGAGRRK